MNEDKATRYQRLRRRAQALSFFASAALLVTLVASGAAVGLRRLLGPLADGTQADPASLPVIAFYALLLALAFGLVAFPFRLVGEWLLERRYGLDRVAFRDWLAAYVRTMPLGLLLFVSAGLVPALAWWASPVWWWLLAAIVAGAARIGLAALTPLLLNWFNDVRPMRRSALAERLGQLAARAGVRRGLQVYEWPETAAGRRAQAALIGLGHTRGVLLSDTMLAAFGDEEIEAVVAHELAHFIHHDLWKMVCARAGLLVPAFFIADRLLVTMGRGLGVNSPADAAALPFILLGVMLALAAAEPVMLAWSRAHERRADAFALRLTGNADALLSVLRRAGALNLAEERPSPLTTWFASHPPLCERVAAIKAWQTHAQTQQAGSSSHQTAAFQ